MKLIATTLRSLTKKGQSNLTKIISLSIGLAVGLVLISKVFFEMSYDNFYPESDRIYQIHTDYKMVDEEAQIFPQVSGAIAPGMKAEVPGVEAATRLTGIADKEDIFTTADKSKYTGSAILADSCLFDVLPRPMLAGNAKEVLSRPMYALVSRSIAEKIGGDVIGKTIEYNKYPNRLITIGGVFEDIPDNSSRQYDIIVSLESIAKFTGDGRNDWLGNDRYQAYVKLHKDIDAKTLAPAIRDMQARNQPLEEIEKAGVSLKYILAPLSSLHSEHPDTKRMTTMLTLLALILITVSVMNYVLIVTSTLVGRSKTIAIHKCYGAGKNNVSKLVFVEISVHLVLALIIAFILIAVSKSVVVSILDTSLNNLFSLQTCLLLVAVCIVILLFTGLIPSYLFNKIPVASAIKNYKVSNRVWRLGLLFVQVTSVFFLIMLLVIVGRQYEKMINNNPGYEYEKLLTANINGTESKDRQKLIDALEQSPLVDKVGSSDYTPLGGLSGNSVSLIGESEDIFNMADFEWISSNYFNVLGIRILEGRGPDSETASKTDIYVSQAFAERLIEHTGWTDGVVGKSVKITMHGERTIAGVYNDIRLGSITSEDKRPSAAFLTSVPKNILSIKVHNMDAKTIAEVDNILASIFPNKEIHPRIYTDEVIKQYNDSLQFRNSVLIGGIVTVIISIIGLIGYLRNEVIRRSKEIAIRKVNGATLMEIIRLFIKDIILLSLPAIVIGEVGAYFVANKWMENYSIKYEPSIFVYLGCAIGVLIFILAIVNMYCMRVANANPIDSLQNE